MPHVSHRRLQKKAFQKIQKQLVRALTRLDSKIDARLFINEFLTETEKTMLAKRLAIIYMLERGHSFSAVQKRLKVSPSTVDRIQKLIWEGNFYSITKYIPKKKHAARAPVRSFWKDLEEGLMLGDYSRRRRL